MTLIGSLLIELELGGSDVGKNATVSIGQPRKVEKTPNNTAAAAGAPPPLVRRGQKQVLADRSTAR